MDSVCEVQHRGALGEFHEFPFWREHKNLVLVEVHLEIVENLPVVIVLESAPYACEPFVHIAVALDSLVSPVCGETALGNFVHALSSYLHFHPLVLWSFHGDVQTFVAV